MSPGVDEKCLLHRPPQDTFRIAIGEARTGAPTSRLWCPLHWLVHHQNKFLPPAPIPHRLVPAPIPRPLCPGSYAGASSQTHTWLALRLRLI
jgi:hypothetical protein